MADGLRRSKRVRKLALPMEATATKEEGNRLFVGVEPSKDHVKDRRKRLKMLKAANTVANKRHRLDDDNNDDDDDDEEDGNPFEQIFAGKSACLLYTSDAADE